MAKQSDTVTVSGNVRVKHQFRQLIAQTSGLPAPLTGTSPLVRVGVRAHVKRRAAGNVWGPWRELGTDVTDFAGAFRISSVERRDDRRFRIDVRFQDDDLRVHGRLPARWITVFEQDDFGGSGDLEGALLIFGDRGQSTSPGATKNLEDDEDLERADIWSVARRTMTLLEDLGVPFEPGLLRGKPVEIVAPVLATLAGPLRRDVHLDRGESLLLLLHEMMHVWLYDRTKPLAGGQALIVVSACSRRRTHELREFIPTAFNEGFAEFCANKLLEIQFGEAPVLPFSRTGLACMPLPTLDDVLHNDLGWMSILHVLTTPNLQEIDFGVAPPAPCIGGFQRVVRTPEIAPPGCTSPFIRFETLLGSFAANSSRGFDRLAAKDMRDLDAFLARVTTLAGGPMAGTAEKFRRLIDPRETVQPIELFC